MSLLLKYSIYTECFIKDYGSIIWVHIFRNIVHGKTSTADNFHILGGNWLLAENLCCSILYTYIANNLGHNSQEKISSWVWKTMKNMQVFPYGSWGSH